jgi:hypothetical protein
MTRNLGPPGQVLTGSMLHSAGYDRINAPSRRFAQMAYEAAP